MVFEKDSDAGFPDGQNEIPYDAQQISPDLFGAQENTGEENTVAPDKGPAKKSFAELRKNRAIPRLKKNKILAGLLVFVIGFLLLFNLVLGKKEKQKQNGLSGRGGQIVYNAEFSLGDMPERAPELRDVDEMLAQDLSAIEVSDRFRSPPSYEDFETKTDRQEQGIMAQNRGVSANSGGNFQAGYSESAAQAVMAPIRKDGGYGQSPTVPVVPNQDSGRATPATNIPTKEDYTRQQLDS
jgi:hypothetical protein